MKSYPLTPLEPREHDIQGSILVYLAWDNRVAWAHRFNFGAHAITTTDPAGQVKRRFVRYAFPGCADILGQLVTGHFLAIEVKRRGGCVRPLQRPFLEQVRRGGGLAGIGALDVARGGTEDVEHGKSLGSDRGERAGNAGLRAGCRLPLVSRH